MAEFVCNLCLFEEPRELSEDDRADREVLTVINGQMVCMAHQGYAQGGEHSVMLRTLREQERTRPNTAGETP
ncbi:hypothetical protein [Streptomyces sp.]|uniref:hypothetical protein n=1 Tax=Streptomyces sp. TaxID=1931 RepID=UPI002F94191B